MLLYHRHNLTEELLGNIFGVSQPTVSRTINFIETTLAKVLQAVVFSAMVLFSPVWCWEVYTVFLTVPPYSRRAVVERVIALVLYLAGFTYGLLSAARCLFAGVFFWCRSWCFMRLE